MSERTDRGRCVTILGVYFLPVRPTRLVAPVRRGVSRSRLIRPCIDAARPLLFFALSYVAPPIPRFVSMEVRTMDTL